MVPTPVILRCPAQAGPRRTLEGQFQRGLSAIKSPKNSTNRIPGVANIASTIFASTVCRFARNTRPPPNKAATPPTSRGPDPGVERRHRPVGKPPHQEKQHHERDQRVDADQDAEEDHPSFSSERAGPLTLPSLRLGERVAKGWRGGAEPYPQLGEGRPFDRGAVQWNRGMTSWHRRRSALTTR